MKTMDVYSGTENATSISLHELVDEVIKKSLNTALHNRNSMVNNVATKFHVSFDEDKIATIANGMLQSLIVNTSESVIYISARDWYDNKMIQLNMRDENCYNTYGVALNLQDLVPKAEALGGYLDITNQRQKITTISFRFPSGHDQAS